MILLGSLVFFAAALRLAYRKWRKQKNLEALSRQLRLSLQTLVHALRVGVGLQHAIERVAREGEEPLAAHWRYVLGACQVGKSLTAALKELPARVPIDEINGFVAAVCITQQTGGSLADVLETLAATLQERQTLKDKVSALTAQGKASGILLGVLPFLLMGAIFFIAPEFVVPLFTTIAGQCIFAVVLVLVTIGGLVIQSIVSIKVDA